MNVEGYTITDLSAMRELAHRNSWTLGPSLDDLIDHVSVSNLQYLTDRGYDADVAMRAAITWDSQRWPGRGYREVFNPDPEPTPPERDWLLDCGYTTETVDAYLAKLAEQQRHTEARAAERAAYERTWRYKMRRGRKIAKDRARLAWSALRGQHDCGEEW